MPKVIVVGSANIDFTVTVDHLPAAGETVIGKDFSQSFGGKGANQAVAAHRAGADVVFLTKLGCDANGQLIKQYLMSEGLPPEGLLHHPSRHTGVALILVDHTGQNVIAVAPGSNQTLDADDVRRYASLFADRSVLLAQLETSPEAVAEALAIAKAHRVTTILNPAPATPLPSDLLKLVDVLTPNEGEAQALTGRIDPAEAARALIRQGARFVVVTLAERGALLENRQGTRLFPAYPAHAVDTTAAGDAFNGALACALAEGRSLASAITFANAAGALTTTKRGAQDALPPRTEIERLLRRVGQGTDAQRPSDPLPE